jgi:aryl-alcohol dehydrogenase-like predicted oxidoreductase
MNTRKFGRTGHMSTIAILGAAAFGNVDQESTDRAMREVMQYGVNHIDIAPSYGHAEEKLAKWIRENRQQFFVGCKTLERSYKGARRELRDSLNTLGISHFDLYQIHAVKDLDDLDQAMKEGSVLEAMIKARKEGLIKHIGITGHRAEIPVIIQAALDRFDFDSVLFPISFGLFSFPEYRRNALKVLETCKERNVAVMAIKSIQKAPWGDRAQAYETWYEPYMAEADIQRCVDFTLSQDVNGIPTAGDVRLLEKVLAACEKFQPMEVDQQDKLMAKAGDFEPLYPMK